MTTCCCKSSSSFMGRLATHRALALLQSKSGGEAKGNSWEPRAEHWVGAVRRHSADDSSAVGPASTPLARALCRCRRTDDGPADSAQRVREAAVVARHDNGALIELVTAEEEEKGEEDE